MTNQDKHFNLSDVNTLHRAMMEHSAMTQDVGEVKSFPVELAMIAAVLHEQNMPQTTINIVLAARCGLPMQKLDPRSMCVRWTEDDPSVEQ